jgi:hypothetical protein
MARPVSEPRVLGRQEFLNVIVDPILHLINRGGSSAIRVSRIPLPQPAAG